MFDVPVVLFIFKRVEKTCQIIKKIAEVQPAKLYLIADGGRTEEEHEIAEKCRRAAEGAVDWDCEVITNYAESNRGVYENIAGGAKWVFEREEKAIFLEDDNMPEVSFFAFCKEMLDLYEDNEKILWICGTNYLEKFRCKYDYVFTKHMLPCGWASWGKKFLKYYDGELSLYTEESKQDLRKAYFSEKMYRYDISRYDLEVNRKKNGEKYCSWDFQMAFSIRHHDLLGVVPCKNQICNIGVDAESIHGGTSFDSIMTKRFCGIRSYSISFPIKHPDKIKINQRFERKTTKIVIPPNLIVKSIIAKCIRWCIRVPDGVPLKTYLHGLMKKEN